MSPSRPKYEALDSHGHPYIREAHSISELPHKNIRPALDQAALAIGAKIGLEPAEPLSFGLLVHESFGLTRQEARQHSQAKTLLTRGADLSLDLVGTYAGQRQ